MQTGEENLRMMARLSGRRRAAARRRARQLLEQFGLTDVAGRGSQRTRAGCAGGLIWRPA